MVLHTLPLNDIIKPLLIPQLPLRKCQYELLMRTRKDQALECVVAPSDLADGVDEKRRCLSSVSVISSIHSLVKC